MKNGDENHVDLLPSIAALTRMLESHLAAARALDVVLPQLEAAAQCVAKGVQGAGTLHYAAAGSSGLMALADASELTGTFGIPATQIAVSMAGGVPVDGLMPGGVEDDVLAAKIAAQRVNAQDVCLVLSASGTTPYAVTFARTARARQAKVIAIANVAHSELLRLADIAIPIPTGAEVLEGSTRLGAGTAQKLALNMISTRAGIVLGHVHHGLMVNLTADNIKLRQRSVMIVMRITGVSRDVAETALMQSKYNTKEAILIAQGLSAQDAKARLEQAKGCLKRAL